MEELHYHSAKAMQHSYRNNDHKALFKAVLNAVPVAIALLDNDHQVVLGNRRYNHLIVNIEQDPIELLLHALRESYGIHSFREWADKQKEVENIELYLPPTHTTHEHWFNCFLTQLPITDTSHEGYFLEHDSQWTVLTIDERTRERMLLEDRRLDAVRLMATENKLVHAMQEALMATVHQLQGPLNMVDAAIAMLKSRHHHCPGIEAMEEAKDNGVKALSEIQQAIPERPDEPFQLANINQLIRDVTAMNTAGLLRRSIQLQLDLTTTLESITAKPSRLLLMLNQLIENAIDAIACTRQQERTIRINTQSTPENIIITIEDSGHGIPEQLRLKIFQPFFTSKPSTQEGCRGIGMSIVQQVVNEHSALITLGTSEQLGGALITLTLPKKQEG